MRTLLLSPLLLSLQLCVTNTPLWASSEADELPVQKISILATLAKRNWFSRTQGAAAVSWLDDNHVLTAVGRKLISYDKDENGYQHVIFTANRDIQAIASGRGMIVVGSDKKIDLLDRDGKKLQTFLDEGKIESLAISQDGRIIASCRHTSEGTSILSVYDTQKKQLIKKFEFEKTLKSIAVSSDGTRLAIAHENQVSYGPINESTELWKKRDHKDIVNAVVFTDKGIYSGGVGSQQEGSLICHGDEATYYYSADGAGKPLDEVLYRSTISGLSYGNNGIWVLANKQDGTDPIVTFRKNGKNTFFNLKVKSIVACAVNRLGQLAVAGDVVAVIDSPVEKNKNRRHRPCS